MTGLAKLLRSTGHVGERQVRAATLIFAGASRLSRSPHRFAARIHDE